MTSENDNKKRSMNATLRMEFLAADKETLTVSEARDNVCRVFAAHFLDEDHAYDDDTTTELLENLLTTLDCLRYRVSDVAATMLAPRLKGEEASQRYREHVIALYRACGFDKAYAEETAMWPDILPIENRWGGDLRFGYDDETLERLARLEVGNDLWVLDATAAFAKKTNS